MNNNVISPCNKNFAYLDEDHKLIAEKSDKNSECFDVLVFASRNITDAFIPSSIKYIDPYSFHYCDQLQNVDFDENSQLISIGYESFEKKISHKY